MTAERRLAKLETALSPRAATLLWLAEAHQFSSLPLARDHPLREPPVTRTMPAVASPSRS
jgi:hypothetical protein